MPRGGARTPRPTGILPAAGRADAPQNTRPLTDRMHIDIWEVLDAASTKPYGFMRSQPGVGDIHESPVLKILTLLSALGAELRYHDPHVPTLVDHGLSSIPLAEALQDADLVLIVTAHPGVDHDTVLTRARLVVDLRGITRDTLVENVVRLQRTAGSPARRPPGSRLRTAVERCSTGAPPPPPRSTHRPTR